jgi:hypothetical protein
MAMSWQMKGWLWLAAALIAVTLAAGTSGAARAPAAQTTASSLPCTSALATDQPEVAKRAGQPSSYWHSG